MASAVTERRPGAQEKTAVGPAHLAESSSGGHAQDFECPVMADPCLVPAYEACRTLGEDKCPTGPVSEPEVQEEQLKLEEERLKLEVELLEERGPRPTASIVRASHGPKRKPVNLPGPSYQAHPRAEAEMPHGLPLQKEESESSQSEPLPSAKQHKKAKKRKSLGTPVLPALASTVSAPSETLGLEPPALTRVFAGKAQRLRPLYQYINYCNPELNQAGEGDREAEAEMETELELALVPEEAGVEQLQALLPVAGEQSAFGLTRRVQQLRSPMEVSEFICLPQEWHLRNTSHLLEATAGPDFARKVAPLTEALVPFSWQPGGSGGYECSP
ncbi:uncharacterized protein C16orf86 homolog [Neovison vison]|uniref:uncharacterized protein C16orf86 homolog n=1 Tax=Neovison vison TaxID=452646 RepID=UPI001CEFEA16|nr:uncharacterized protein C16orf86 homolog [Neogale vison]